VEDSVHALNGVIEGSLLRLVQVQLAFFNRTPGLIGTYFNQVGNIRELELSTLDVQSEEAFEDICLGEIAHHSSNRVAPAEES
jgi:hypothetical protein